MPSMELGDYLEEDLTEEQFYDSERAEGLICKSAEVCVSFELGIPLGPPFW